MLFHSHEYVFLFLPFVVLVYHLLGHAVASKIWLLLASLLFYSWWNPVFTPLLIASITANYSIGIKLIQRPNRSLLIVGICANLALLGYFKYANFFLDAWRDLTSSQQPILNVALPLAISFYTFQQIAFLVDAHKQKIVHKKFLDYALFATFFPHLIAGPILHHKAMISQFAQLHASNYDLIARGIFVFVIGLFKVLVIAAPLSTIVDEGYRSLATLSLLDAWTVAVGFMLQLYFDFSGYTDMAIGSALMLGIVLPDNFHSPYRVRNIIQFWQAWHITLGRYFRDYFLIPFSGKKSAPLRRNIIVFLTFCLIGLWHGAAWTFVVFGIANGIAIVMVRQWEKAGISLPYAFSWFITMLFLLCMGCIFRAPDLHAAGEILAALLPWHSADWFTYTLPASYFFPGTSAFNALWALPFGFCVCAWPINSIHLRARFVPNRFYLGATILLFLVAVLKMSAASTFIYFQF